MKRYVLMFSLVGMTMPAHAGWWDTAVSWWGTTASAVTSVKNEVFKRVEQVTPEFVKNGYHRATKTVAQTKERVEEQIKAAPLTAMAAVATVGALSVAAWYNIRKFCGQGETPANHHVANGEDRARVALINYPGLIEYQNRLNAENANLRERAEVAEEILEENARFASLFQDDLQKEREQQQADLVREREAKEEAEREIKRQEETLQQRLKEHKHQQEEMQGRIEELDRLLKAKEQRRQAADSRLSTHMQGAHKRLKAHEEQCKEMQQCIETLQTERVQNQKDIEHRSQLIVGEMDKVSVLEQGLEQRQNEVDFLNHELLKVEQGNVQLVSRITQLEKQIEKEREEEFEQSEALKQDKEERLRKLEELNADLEAQREKERLVRERFDEELSKGKANVTVLSLKCEAQGEAKELSSALSPSREIVSELQQELNSAMRSSELFAKEEVLEEEKKAVFIEKEKEELTEERCTPSPPPSSKKDLEGRGLGASVDLISQWWQQGLGEDDADDNEFVRIADKPEFGSLLLQQSMFLSGDLSKNQEVENKVGAELCRVIVNPERPEDVDYIENLKKGDPLTYLQKVSDLYDYLLDIAKAKGQFFDQGSFLVYDPEGRICEFLRHPTLTYQRPTSHLTDLFRKIKEKNKGKKLLPPYDIECSWRTFGYEVTTMEGLNLVDEDCYSLMSERAGKKRHIFCANLGRLANLDDTDAFRLGKYTFLKAENWAPKGRTYQEMIIDVLGHTVEFAISRYNKFVGGDDDSNYRKERVPAHTYKIFVALANKLSSDDEKLAQAKAFGISEMHSQLKDLTEGGVVGACPNKISAAVELLKGIETDPVLDHLDLGVRIGREVILTQEELLNGLREQSSSSSSPISGSLFVPDLTGGIALNSQGGKLSKQFAAIAE